MPAIPFADLSAQHRAIAGELEAAIRDVIRECAFIRGPRVEAFEREANLRLLMPLGLFHEPGAAFA